LKRKREVSRKGPDHGSRNQPRAERIHVPNGPSRWKPNRKPREKKQKGHEKSSHDADLPAKKGVNPKNQGGGGRRNRNGSPVYSKEKTFKNEKRRQVGRGGWSRGKICPKLPGAEKSSVKNAKGPFSLIFVMGWKREARKAAQGKTEKKETPRET